MMKIEIDDLMQKADFKALFVTGACMHNPFMVYLAGGTYHVSQAELIKKPGTQGVLFHQDMERDEAAKTGFNLQGNRVGRIRSIQAETKSDE